MMIDMRLLTISIWIFLLKRTKIIEKYNDFKSNHKYRELMYEFPNRENRFNLKETSNNFWKN